MTSSGAINVTGSLDGAGGNLDIRPNGRSCVAVEISGTFVSTYIIEELTNRGAWVTAAQVFDAAGSAASATTTVPVRRFVNSSGRGGIRVRQTAYTSGTATIDLEATDGSAAAGGSGGGSTVVAVAHGVNPTAVAAGATTVPDCNRAGIPFVIGGHPNIQTIRVNYTAAQTDTAIITIATGLKIIVTGFLVTADAACTVNTTVRLGFGTANTPTGAGVIGSHPGIAPGSGFGRGGGAGIIGVGADDADLRITSSAPTGGSIDVDVSYYTIES